MGNAEPVMERRDRKVSGSHVFLRILRTLVSKAVVSFGTIFLTFVIANKIGLPELGQFSTAVAIMLGVVVLANFGSTTLINKEGGIALQDGNLAGIRGIYNNGVKLSLLISGLFAVFGTIFLVKNGDEVTQFWFFLATPGVAFLYLNASLIRANLNAALAPFFEFGCISLLTSFVILLAAHMGGTLNVEFLGKSVAIITYFLLLVSLFIIHRQIPNFWSVHPVNRGTILSQSKKSANFFVIEFAQYFTQGGFIIVVGLFLPDESVGIFTTVLQVAFLVNFILGVTSNTISAQVASLHATGESGRMKKLRLNTIKTMLSLAFPLAIFIFIFSNFVLKHFNIDSSTAVLALRLLLVAQVLNVATGLAPIFLRMIGAEKILRNIILFTLLLQISGAIILTPKLGVLGPALAFSVALMTKNLLAYLFERKISKQLSKA